jgi:hypothetical protein
LIKVIGAGLPRTATTTQLFAFEQLGFAPCYHMRDLLGDLEGGLPKWEAVAAGNPDWEDIFGEATSTCDWPSARWYADLIDYYPEAKVVLSVREGASWVRSMRETVWGLFFGDSVMRHASYARTVVDPLWGRYIALMTGINWDEETGVMAGDHASDEGLIAIMDAWNDGVRRTVPAERLLEWYPTDGWEPLCEFLDVAVPDGPVPNLNDTAAFKEGLTGGAIAAINDWWDAREKPAGGLHGAAVT